VQVPPDQSRADRSAASVAIHRATGGCRSVHSEETGREDSAPKSVHRSDADVFSLAEGSIRQRPRSRGRAGIGGVPSPGHVSKEIGRELKRAPHLLRARKKCFFSGREVRAPEGRPEGARTEGGAVLQPRSTAEGGEPQGSRKGRPRNPLEGRGEQAYESVERRHGWDTEPGKSCAQTSTE
jgi:hypothetical protein